MINHYHIFQQNIKDIFGDDGQHWLNTLPTRVKNIEKLFGITLKKPMPNLTYSFVALVETKSGPAILKVAPKSERLDREICWYQEQKTGSAQLIMSDNEQGALLLEYLQAGISLKQKVMTGKDDEATEIIAQVITELNPQKASNTSPFPHVRRLLKDLKHLLGRVDDGLINYSLDLFNRLLEVKEDCLLHGDLHHDNILSHGAGYKAIDPHGYIGPQAFEVGASIRNPYDCLPKYRSLCETVTRRLNILNELLPFSRDEINGWALIYTLIAASWSIQDHGDLPAEHVEIANIIRSKSEIY